MSKWLFEGIKVGDQVVFNGMCLKTVCYVSDTCFDVGSTRFRKRDGKPVKAKYPAKLDPVSSEWIQYLKEEYGISPNEDQQPDSITFTLTREQAGQLKADLYREYMCGSVLGVIKQIEEKLR